MFWRKETNRAAAFVDHEYWFISMKNFYHTKPGLKDWCSRLRESYQVESSRFFGNCLDRDLAEEVARIREVSNEIIETNCDNAGRFMKDMSDVIMLDAIYRQAAVRRPPPALGGVTGGGPFKPAG